MKRLFFIIVIGSLFTSFLPVAQAELKCDLCQQTIKGKYVQYKTQHQTKTVCIDCKNNKPKCAACDVPHLGHHLHRHKGEALCNYCMRHAKYCSLCDHRIEGQFYKLNGKSELFCQSCYTRNPKCKICGEPKPRINIDLKSGACLSCLPKLEKCESCGNRISGRYYEFQFHEGKFCEECKLNRNSCYVCGVPVGVKYWKYPDGRVVCLECNKDAVISVEEIQQIMKEVDLLCRQRLGLNVETPYELTVQQLNDKSLWDAKSSKEGKTFSSPLFGKELGLYRYMNRKSEIFLLYGLPRAMVYETAGHEYAHAWQVENCPPDQSELLREGFAQWVGAQILKIKGFSKALTRLEARRDHPYGTGYHRFKIVEGNLGRDGVIEYAKKTVK